MGLAVTQRAAPLRHVSDELTLTTSFMLAAAGLAHVSVTPAHFEEWWVFGALFLLTAVLQLGLAICLLVRPSPARYGLAAAVNVGLIATWLVSRTSGLPFGPDAGVREALGPLDLLTTLIEATWLAAVGFAAAGATHGRRLRVQSACQASGVALGIALTLAFAGGIGHG